MPVTLNFGDGSPQDSTEYNVPVEHEFAGATPHVVLARDGAKRGQTTVTGPGKYSIVVEPAGGPPDPPPNPDPAKPTLTVADRAVQVGGPAVEYTSRLQNTQGTSEACVVHSTLSAPGITPESIVTEYDSGGGTWEAVSTVQDGADRIRFDFGTDGFTLDPTYDQTTNLRQTIPAGSPLQPRAAQGRQWVDSTKDGKTLGEATYTVTVQAASGAPAPQLDAVTPDSGTVGDTATITGDNLGGTA